MKNSCKNFNDLNPYSRFPRITISGLTSALDTSISDLSSEDAEFDSVVPTFGASGVVIEPALELVSILKSQLCRDCIRAKY